MPDEKSNPETAPVTKPVVAKQAGKKTEVTEVVVVETQTFQPEQPIKVEEAEAIFRDMVKQSYGDAPLSDVRCTKVNHRVGISAEYHFTATLG